jgi:ABC-type multidrug transport system ATPase subunit
MPDPLIHIHGLRKRFGDILALDGLYMEVYPGDIYGFLGPNGSGKSTTLRIITSLVRQDAGTVNLFGMPVIKARKQILSRVGALIERPDFYGHLTARRNLSMMADYSKFKVGKGEIYEVLEMVGLKGRENDRVSTFSDGMKQRLGIAQAMIHKPELLILDEPFNSLDPQGVKDVRDLTIQLNRDFRVTIVISSHQLDEIEKLANRLVVISEGKTVTEGPMRTLLETSEAKIHLSVDKVNDACKLIHQKGLVIDRKDEASGQITLTSPLAEIPALNRLLVSHGIQVYAMKPDQSLESLFLNYTAKA